MSRPVDLCPVCLGPDYVPHEVAECAAKLRARLAEVTKERDDAHNAQASAWRRAQVEYEHRVRAEAALAAALKEEKSDG